MRTKIKQLKVKIKSLAAEANIIRVEERRARSKQDVGLFISLRNHRIYLVREETRYSQIAYGFLRGRPYNVIEPKTHKPINWYKVQKMIERFGVTYNWFGDTPTPRYVSLADRKKSEQARFAIWRQCAEEYTSLK